MDNLELLKRMEDESVDLIYCDILYNTGRKFEDYDDNLGTPQDAIEWYKPRLLEMQRVLSKNGSIYLQCDYRLVHHIRLEMDNIFGVNNFLNEIIWHYTKMNATNRKFIQNHDNILLYKKGEGYTFNIQYNDVESALKTRLNKYIKNDKIVYADVKNHKSQLMDNYLKSAKNRLNKDVLDDSDIVIDFKNKGMQKVDTVWKIPIVKGNSNENVGYNTQKPKALLERIVRASSNEGDTIADFFCGSGTTGVVAKELGRNYILCDIGDKAVEISEKRLSEVICH